jgi:transketolase
MDLDKKKINEIRKFSVSLRKNILEMSLAAGASSSHFGGALSIVEIVAVLFCNEMKIKNGDPYWEERDRFILSKGHACLAYYAALCEKGFIKKDELKTFEKDNSNLLGHPVLNQKLGIDFSNGSLGMGLSLGIGLAIASKKRGTNFKTYVIVGDGECNEGSVWESAMAAPNLNLENLYVIIDKNNFQQTGSNKEIMNTENLKKKWDSFGWHTTEIDGHNINEIIENFKKISNENRPKAIIANTVKGKGFSFSENNNDWHHSVLTQKMYDQAIEELKKNDIY